MPALPSPSGSLTIGNFDDLLDPNAHVLDLSRLTFIDAYGLVGAACALQPALAENTQLPIEPPSSSAMCAHLDSMGFRDFLSRHKRGFESSMEVQTHAASGVVVPLRSAADSGGEQALSHLLWDQLQERVAPQILGALTEGVWELVANALEHSGSDALVMAQIYTADIGKPPHHDDRIQVVIGDYPG